MQAKPLDGCRFFASAARRAPGVGVEMPERFQQQIAEAALGRISGGKQVVAQAMGEEVLHEVLAVLLRATGAAEVAIDRLPVAADEEVENRPLFRAHARAQGEVFAPLGLWKSLLPPVSLRVSTSALTLAGRSGGNHSAVIAGKGGVVEGVQNGGASALPPFSPSPPPREEWG